MPRPKRTTYLDIDRPYLEIGERIKQFRISKGLDQSDVASQLQMSRVETGLRAPTMDLLKRIRELGADLNWIISGDD